MYKVFFNDKFILLTDEFAYDVIESGVLFLQYEDFEEIHFVIELLKESDLVNAVVIASDDIDMLWADFRSHFMEIDAAGGLVSNSQNDLLLIHRNEMWDLPKGKLEDSEHASDGALREVEEECGISDLQLIDKVTTSYHVYSMKGFNYLKRTFWYSMLSNQREFIPQGEEGIDKVEWVSRANLDWENRQTYASIRDVVKEYLHVVA